VMGVEEGGSACSNQSRQSCSPTPGSTSWPSRLIFTGLFSFHGFFKDSVWRKESSPLEGGGGGADMSTGHTPCPAHNTPSSQLPVDPLQLEDSHATGGDARWENPGWRGHVPACARQQAGNALELATLLHREHQQHVPTVGIGTLQLLLVERRRRPHTLHVAGVGVGSHTLHVAGVGVGSHTLHVAGVGSHTLHVAGVGVGTEQTPNHKRETDNSSKSLQLECLR